MPDNQDDLADFIAYAEKALEASGCGMVESIESLVAKWRPEREKALMAGSIEQMKRGELLTREESDSLLSEKCPWLAPGIEESRRRSEEFQNRVGRGEITGAEVLTEPPEEAIA